MNDDERGTRTTAELDSREIQGLLAEPRPTQLIARDELLGLIDASAAEEPSESKIHMHTVPRRGRPSPARIARGSSPQEVPVQEVDDEREIKVGQDLEQAGQEAGQELDPGVGQDVGQNIGKNIGHIGQYVGSGISVRRPGGSVAIAVVGVISLLAGLLAVVLQLS